MPVEFGLWRLEGNKPQPINSTSMVNERRLEDVLVENIDVLGLFVMLVGRQIPTDTGGYIDLLAIDAEGTVYVIELKRNRTPRDVVAQLLDYASWVRGLAYEDIKEIHDRYAVPGEASFEESFADAFGESPGETINEQHRLVLVAAEIDASSERIVSYLTEDYGVPINAVFFRYFRDDKTDAEYLGRSWLIDPDTVETNTTRARGRREPWNGHDYYVTFGNPEVRNWEDARAYGFVSAGGGPRQISPLQRLSPGDRVFTLVPGSGYVGVGLVRQPAVPITDFEVDGTPLLELPLQSPALDRDREDADRCEHVVAVEWMRAVPEAEAYWERGMFAIPNTVCALRQRFTIERLAEHFELPPYEDGLG